jgi:mRNA interferase RelE/StbE
MPDVYEMSFSNVARRFLERADRSLRQRLKATLLRLREDPRALPGVKSLHGKFAGHLGCRVGEHRVVYRVNDDERRIVVIAIGHRREIYR